MLSLLWVLRLRLAIGCRGAATRPSAHFHAAIVSLQDPSGPRRGQMQFIVVTGIHGAAHLWRSRAHTARFGGASMQKM